MTESPYSMGPPGRPKHIPGPEGRPEPWQQRFQSLQPYRVLDILLVSSAYDAFVLEEDGSLTDRLYSHYLELSLSATPRITHASTTAFALKMLQERHFDVVFMVVRPGGAGADELSRRIKAMDPSMPVVLLIFDETDLEAFPDRRVPPAIDRVFLWGGSTDVLLAAIKSIEDMRNASHDTTVAGVSVMIVVEDGIRGYSSFLSLLYPLLFQQSRSLIAEGLNDHHRLLRMRARPKILLATTVAEAEALYHHHADYVTALLTDMRMPNLAGHLDPRAGLSLAVRWRKEHWDLPVLFQSAEVQLRGEVEELGAWFVDKNAADFRGRVNRFLLEALGFGDFVFRLPDRTEVGRASDVYEMERLLPTVPEASIRYHAEHNHFSLWLTARSLFHLARRIRPMRIDDFDGVQDLTTDFVRMLREARFYEQESVITDISSTSRGTESRFIRLGRGSIGGKGRSVAFVSSLIVGHGLLTRHSGLQIRIPKTVVLGTDAFDRFVEPLDVPALIALEDDEELYRQVQDAALPADVLNDLRLAFADLEGPLAVRSSTLLEDSRFRPFAGVYHTEMLANGAESHQVRFEALCRAIKQVYASTFATRAKRYLAGTPHDTEEQKMAVCIQQVVGRDYGRGRFYPVLSGVAQSCNLYPVGGQAAEDGVAHLALGLGHTVVGGGIALRFSPGSPQSLPQFPDATSFLRGSQRRFYAVSTESRDDDDQVAGVRQYELKAAEEDGVLHHVASVYQPQDDVLRDNLRLKGPRVVTFNNILKWRSIPLAEALVDLLERLREGLGEEVEMEFAVDVPGGGQDARLYVLQVRPQGSVRYAELELRPEDVPETSLLVTTDLALGHGSSAELYDVVHVVANPLLPQRQRDLCREISAIDRQLRDEGRPYVLIGPGRWGSSDGTLGISVSWSDISGARVIVETPIGERRVEPSQGTHFFRNITAAHVAYLTVTATESSWLKTPWLDARWREQKGDPQAAVRHLQLETPVRSLVDGRRSRGVIVIA